MFTQEKFHKRGAAEIEVEPSVSRSVDQLKGNLVTVMLWFHTTNGGRRLRVNMTPKEALNIGRQLVAYGEKTNGESHEYTGEIRRD